MTGDDAIHGERSNQTMNANNDNSDDGQGYRAVCTCGAKKVGPTRAAVDNWAEDHFAPVPKQEFGKHTVEVTRVIDRVRP